MMQDLSKMGTNLVQFQKLHFFAIVEAQVFAPGDAKHLKHVKVPVQEVTSCK